VNYFAPVIQERLVRAELPHHPENKPIGPFVEYLKIEVDWHDVLQLRFIEENKGGPPPAAIREPVGRKIVVPIVKKKLIFSNPCTRWGICLAVWECIDIEVDNGHYEVAVVLRSEEHDIELSAVAAPRLSSSLSTRSRLRKLKRNGMGLEFVRVTHGVDHPS
jgi:hypothetical protein